MNVSKQKLCSLRSAFISGSRGFCFYYSDKYKYTWNIPKFIEQSPSSSSSSPANACDNGRHSSRSNSSRIGRRKFQKQKQKQKEKEAYKPPSSLDTSRTRKAVQTVHPLLTFDFQFSYTETPKNVAPLGFREPKFSPFGPGRLDRPWTGWCAPCNSINVTSIDADSANANDNDVSRSLSRQQILGEPLSRDEIRELLHKNRRHATQRQVNLGRDGFTHNMLNNIHDYWKKAPAVRIKCLGVPTVDMKNVCFELEDKTGGKIIYRNRGTIILFRGRNYNIKTRPEIPLMLWKPHSPVYPRLIKTTIEGLSVEETKKLRKRGGKIEPLVKLKKNGDYCDLVHMVQQAFKNVDLVRIDCKGLPKSDYKKIGAKLKDLVPCVLVSFDNGQIVIWKGKDLYGEGTACSQQSNCLFAESSVSSEVTERNI